MFDDDPAAPHVSLAGSFVMRRNAFLVSIFVLLWGFAVSAASGQEIAYAPSETGFDLSLTGIEEVIAVSGLDTSVVGGLAAVSQITAGSQVNVKDVFSRTSVVDAFHGNQGILMLNQESGNLNSQANVRSLALAGGGGLFQDLDAWRLAVLIGNTVTTGGGQRENLIEGSFGGTAGLVGVNQSAGNLNQQANILVMGIGLGRDADLLSMGDSELQAVSTGNKLIRNGPEAQHTDSISGSFTGFRGIAQLSQTSGDLNNAGNFLGISYQVLDVTP